MIFRPNVRVAASSPIIKVSSSRNLYLLGFRKVKRSLDSEETSKKFFDGNLNHLHHIDLILKKYDLVPQQKQRTLNAVEDIISYRFRNSTLLWKALQVNGTQVKFAGDEAPPEDGNKKLSLVGDAVLALSLIEDWYVRGGTRGNIVVEENSAMAMG